MDKADVGKFVQVKPQGIEPYPRSGHCFATDGTNLFMYGGYNTEYRESKPGHEDVVTENHIFTEMWCFNLSTETWREVETVGEKPTATASMSMIMDTSDHMLLLYGGSGYPWGQNVNADLIAFLLKEKRWKPLECAGDCPDGKYGQSMVVHQGNLYCFGGCRWLPDREAFMFNSELHSLHKESVGTNKASEGADKESEFADKESVGAERESVDADKASEGADRESEGADEKSVGGILTWTLLHDNPEEKTRIMYKHGLALYENKLYIVGSSYRELYNLTHQEQIHVFDLDAKKWTIEDTLRCPKHGYPKQRKYHGWVQWQNEVYICGGHNNKVVLRDVWKLELPNLQWTRLKTTIPVDTFFHTAAITPTKCLYIFGGITDLEDRPRTNAIFRLWLAIPSLLDLALKKVLSLLPDRNVKTIARLQGLGVPPQVMDKLRHVE